MDFECNSRQDFTGYIHGDTWIRLYGILREGMGHISKDITAPFYHLEAVKVEKIPYNGKETIVDGENTALCTEIAIGTFKKSCCLTGGSFF